MKTLAELIAHHRRRERECREEAERAVEFPDEVQSKRSVELWTDEANVSRDTASWLETIQRMAK